MSSPDESGNPIRVRTKYIKEEVFMRLIIAKDYADVSRKAANIIAAQVHLKPDCVLGLATGSSPVGTYKELIAKYESGELDFSKVKTVNLDEYVGLTKDHDQSYAYFMRTNLFDHVKSGKMFPPPPTPWALAPS